MSPAVSLCQFFKQVYDVIHLIRSLRPFADTAETAVIEAILAKRHGVKVNEDADSVLLRPVKGFVKLFQAADKRLAIPINEVRDRDSDRIQSHTCDGCEVALRDKLAAVDPDPGFVSILRQLRGKIKLIFSRCSIEQCRAHPLFKNKPVAKVDTFDLLHIGSSSFITVTFPFS